MATPSKPQTVRPSQAFASSIGAGLKGAIDRVRDFHIINDDFKNVSIPLYDPLICD